MHQRFLGFNLLEVVSGVALLGLIAAFAIPPMAMVRLQHYQYAAVQDDIDSIKNHYGTLVRENRLKDGETRLSTLMESAFKFKRDTGAKVDYSPAVSGRVLCNGKGEYCYRTPSGAIIHFPDQRFRNDVDNVLVLDLDPDGRVSHRADSTGKAVTLVLDVHGRVHTRGTLPPGKTITLVDGTILPYTGGNPNSDPGWYQHR